MNLFFLDNKYNNLNRYETNIYRCWICRQNRTIWHVEYLSLVVQVEFLQRQTFSLDYLNFYVFKFLAECRCFNLQPQIEVTVSKSYLFIPQKKIDFKFHRYRTPTTKRINVQRLESWDWNLFLFMYSTQLVWKTYE